MNIQKLGMVINGKLQVALPATKEKIDMNKFLSNHTGWLAIERSNTLCQLADGSVQMVNYKFLVIWDEVNQCRLSHAYDLA